MPPNLALLIDSDSHTNEIGPTLFKRLHDPNWEVKDSVLEVLNTIAMISEYSKHIRKSLKSKLTSISYLFF